MINVTKSYLPPMEEYIEKLKPIWDSAWLTNMGEYHEELKSRLREYLGVDGIELFVNGHLGLEMAIQAVLSEQSDSPAANVEKGEVITTPFTFASTTHAIVRQGYTPVFADIKRDDCTIDPASIEEKITDKTVAIIPVHVYGHICDVDAIQKIADKHGLKVIYDAAHAFGESYRGESVGNFGDASMFSFHATKVFHTIEGGAVTYKKLSSELDLDDVLYKLKNFGITDAEHVKYVGGNAKMNEFQAAMGLCVLDHIDEIIDKRKALYERYIKNLSKSDNAKLFKLNPEVTYNYAYMPVLFENRDEVFEKLKANGINARKYFYPCVNAYDCYKEAYDEHETNVAAEISRKILTLPLYPDLAEEEVDRICEIANE